VLERDDIARIMRGVPRMERRPGHGLRVVAAVVAEDDDAPRPVRTSALPPGPTSPSSPTSPTSPSSPSSPSSSA
jgi:hypothetical protein